MKTKIIFFGNGPLADYTLKTLLTHCEVVFHARQKADLEEVKRLKTENPSLKGVLASFGVMIKSDVLDLFEPEGILNLHPSLLPLFRGASPIESAILAGDTDFSYSIMKLVKSMDAGPIYHQETIKFDATNLPTKDDIYQTLATSGAKWLNAHLENLPTPTPQNDAFATFTSKLNKTFSPLKPDSKPAHALLNEIRAFYGFPKSTYTFFNTECIILSAHISKADSHNASKKELSLLCSDGDYLVIDKLQPLGRKPMDTKSFLNGYSK